MDYILFGLKFHFNNVAFSIGNIEIYWYGILITIGFALAFLYGTKNARRLGVDPDKMIDVIIFGLIGAVICARAYYLLFDGEPLSAYPTFREKMGYIFGMRDGGIAIYGGIIGAFVAGGITAKVCKIKILDMFDLGAIGFTIGQAVGRWGNFVNQEVYGRPTGSSWYGIGGTRIGTDLVHPLFLYESLWCLGIFFLLHYLSKKRRFSGQLFFIYGAAYSFGRYWFEGMRNTEFILMFGQMSISQLVAICVFIVSIILYFVFRDRSMSKDDGEYTEQFGSMFDDEEMLEAGYALLGCSWEDDDAAVSGAYEQLKAKYAAMIPEDAPEADLTELTDAPAVAEDGTVEISEAELAARAKLKISELDEAYDYIMNNRRIRAEEAAAFSVPEADNVEVENNDN